MYVKKKAFSLAPLQEEISEMEYFCYKSAVSFHFRQGYLQCSLIEDPWPL